jgi:hypothetical protein
VSKGFDATQLEGAATGFDDPVGVDVRHPVTGEKIGLTLGVVSYQSERVKKAARQLGNAVRRDMQRNPKRARTVEEDEEAALHLMASAVVRWNLTVKGEPVECTPANVLEHFSKPGAWFIREQIDKAADDQALFIKA